ncbi:HAD family phosphatase [Pseudomonas putida]|jgi:beta-phosphoglucomutase-like phosphatase (HAD superfamily)|uniref:HAD family phosphatase n=1 Tax=Pseudomonas TaxID=286 RepID=UPI0023635AFC|nr:HAD family phosphatase [Pseudomonas putida]MDD1966807.1 HAD family phosphatase [Pseudomonas putida]
MLAPVAAPAPSFTAVLFGLSGCLVDFGAQARTLRDQDGTTLLSHDAKAFAAPTPGALSALKNLKLQGVPCAWIEEYPASIAEQLAAPLKDLIQPTPGPNNHWPAPDACWQALMSLNVAQIDGCVMVSGDPRLVMSGLNAGLWTVGIASTGPLCGLSPAQWEALSDLERERLRGRATLELYAAGAHSVIDHLGELDSCLADITLRRQKSEKP